MTDLVYLTDSYCRELQAKIVSVKKHGSLWDIVLDKTIFYPQGGGQPSDKGEISGPDGKAHVKHVRMAVEDVVHECSVDGSMKAGDSVDCRIDWPLRFHNMRVHSAGHIVHEAVMKTAPELTPTKGEHGKDAYIEYHGSIPIGDKTRIESEANAIVEKNVQLITELVSLEELKKRSSFVPEHLPKNKPLRILQIDGFDAMPDGGTQVKKSGEVGEIVITEIENTDDAVKVHYSVSGNEVKADNVVAENISTPNFIGMLMEAEQNARAVVAASNKPRELLQLEILGGKGEFAKLTGQIRNIPKQDRGQVGTVVNQVKTNLLRAINEKYSSQTPNAGASETMTDPTMPGVRPPEGHLHIVSQAIEEITRIFERISFTRVRHPEVDWDWYAFGALNMPPSHPARDEWETFFIESKKHNMVLTPHTSNGQVREMEKKVFPIRMINIAKCYRRQIDVSHTPMFHQFEGLYIDKNVSIGHLKGVLDYFVKQFFGPKRVSRIRPFHFQFTEPSFEVDVTCGVCNGAGCRLCKEGWLELGGAGMVHPNVLKNGNVPPGYNGFAFGWGVERCFMMKAGTQLDDIRLLYSNDVRFLEQF